MTQKNKALILGCSGMDGRNLTEYLLTLGYEVHGIIRRHSVSQSQDMRIADLDIKTYYGDLMDQGSLERVMKEVQPNEIYNLAAMSHVRVSFDIPQFTAQTNALGTLNVLEAYRSQCPNARFYQASSSEMFGSSCDDNGYQRETTPMHPVSPYGVSKLFGYHMVRNYRASYGLHASNGILFNHSGKYRGEAFVEQKIAKAAVRIKFGLQDKLELGNVHSYRDIGNSKDYVRAMWLMLQQDHPGDWVVATGESWSILQIVKYMFDKCGVDMGRLVIEDKHKRPEELNYLKGDSSRIRELGWKPNYSMSATFDEMIEHWLAVCTSVRPSPLKQLAIINESY